MPNYSLLLSAALLLTVAASADAFAQGRPAPKKVIQIESMGARAFGGTTVPMPDDPTNLQACDHGFAEWFIPRGARRHPMVLVHGSSTRTYQTTFDGQPGFQSIFLADKYPVYLVDLPWTGRAGKACEHSGIGKGVFSGRSVSKGCQGHRPVFPQPVCRVQRGEQH